MGNKFFPVTIDLNNRKVLIIGGGKVAFRKVETLLKYNCKIKVITKAIEDERFINLVKEKKIDLEEQKTFLDDDLEDVFLVVAATNDESINKYIADLCLAKNILVNNATSKNNMNLRFTSIYETEDFQISVSSNGNPKKSVAIKNIIKGLLEKISLYENQN